MNFSEYRKCLIRRQEILTKTLTVVALVVALIQIERLCGNIWINISPAITFSFFCIIPVILLIQSRRFTVNYMLMLFCVIGAVSLLLNHPVTNYMSSLRFFLFCGMLCMLSPLVDSAHLRQFRKYLWQYAIIMSQIVVLLSLLIYLKMLLFNGEGSLLVLIKHPIMLSTLSAIISIVITWRFLNCDKSKKKIVIIFDFISLIAAIILMVWGGSRSAIISFIIAEIYLFITLYHKWKGTRWWLLATIITTLTAVTLIGGDVTFRVKKKFEIAQEHNSIIFSRKQLWQSRIDEFKDSPIIGIGFTNATYYSTLYNNKKIINTCPDRKEEPGSSWLSVLSNTGIIGFAVLACWNICLLHVIRKRRRNGDVSAVKFGALLIFFITEGFFEGWILYAGSFLFFLYWLLASRITDYKWIYHSNNKSICEKCLGI